MNQTVHQVPESIPCVILIGTPESKLFQLWIGYELLRIIGGLELEPCTGPPAEMPDRADDIEGRVAPFG